MDKNKIAHHAINLSDGALIRENWFAIAGMFEENGGMDFIEAMESEAASELIEAKSFIPEKYLQECGLDVVKSEEELCENREKLLDITAYFAGSSILATVFEGYDAPFLEVMISNTESFCAVLLIGLAAALYEQAGDEPFRLKLLLNDKETADRMKGALDMVIDIFEDYITDRETVYFEEPDNEKAEEAYEEDWTKTMDMLVRHYAKSDSLEDYNMIIGQILRGMADFDARANFGVEADVKNGVKPFRLSRLKDQDGRNYIALLTRPSPDFHYTAGIRLMMLVDEFADEDLAGLVINPYEEAVTIGRGTIIPALDLFVAGIEYGRNEADADKEDEENCMCTDRPMTDDEFARVEEWLRCHEDDAGKETFTIAFNNYIDDDAIDRITVERTENGFTSEMKFDMADFDWDEPLILNSDEIDFDDMLKLLRRVCLEGGTSGDEDIEYIMEHFRT